MTDPRNLRISSVEDLLATVPTFFGFHPEDSVVLISVCDGPNPLNARFDLPLDADDVAALLEDVETLTRRQHGGTVLVAIYTDDAGAAEAVMGPLYDVLEASGAVVPMAVRADGDRFYCLSGCDECPPDGTSYDVGSHPFIAQAVFDGRVIHPSRKALRESLLPTDPDEVEAVSRAVGVAVDRMQTAAGHPAGPSGSAAARAHLVSEGRWVQHRVRRYLQDGQRLDSHDVGRLLVAVLDVDVRDVAWAEMTRQNARAHVELWTDVVRRGPLDALAAPAALLGFAAWLAGEGALAACAAERSQAADPSYSMAALLLQTLACAMPPSSWKPMTPDMLSLFTG